MIKRIIYINLLIIVSTCLQVIWASPDALSSVDLSSSPIDYLEWLCFYPMIVISIMLLLFNRFNVSRTHLLIVVPLIMTIYWLFINYWEFRNRVAGWSTFSNQEIWYYVFLTTYLPLSVCVVIFCLCTHMINKQFDNKTSLSLKNNNSLGGLL